MALHKMNCRWVKNMYMLAIGGTHVYYAYLIFLHVHKISYSRSLLPCTATYENQVCLFSLRLLDPQLTNQCNEMVRCYSNVLYCWRMFNLRAELLSFNAMKDKEQTTIGKDVQDKAVCMV